MLGPVDRKAGVDVLKAIPTGPVGFAGVAWPGMLLGIMAGVLYYWLFTGLRGQTPGKMVVGIKVVGAQGNGLGLGVAALREIAGKLISTIALCVGFLWIAFDDDRQGWHDKIASTHVVRVKSQR